MFQRLREANFSIFCVQESRTCTNSCEGTLLDLARHYKMISCTLALSFLVFVVGLI